jgi:hypothetical protein
LHPGEIAQQFRGINSGDDRALGANELVVTVENCPSEQHPAEDRTGRVPQGVERIDARVQTSIAYDWHAIKTQHFAIGRHGTAVEQRIANKVPS